MPFVKANPVRDPEARQAWAYRHPYCTACGIDAVAAYRERWPGLECHHIVKPGREDSACNLLRLCHRCHSLAEGLSIRVDGVLLPKLPLAVCLTIKLVRNPDEFDAVRLAQLYHRALPEMEPIPAVIEAEYVRRRGTQ